MDEECEGLRDQNQQLLISAQESNQAVQVVLAENKRLSLLPEVSVLFEELKAQLQNTVDVVVTTAFEMTDAQQNKLAESLKAKLKCDVRMSSEIDESLIGGAIIRAGDLVIDGSLTGKLSKLAEAMNS